MLDSFRAIRRWVDQARLWPLRVAGRRKLGRVVLERAGDRSFLVLPEVFNPVTFRSGVTLARYLASSPGVAPRRDNAMALDLGTGCGIQAIFAAARGFDVTATDINVHAVRCARINVLLNRLEGRIKVEEGDLFAPIAGQEFDLVIFNPPFFDGAPANAFDLSWRSTNCIERFTDGLPAALRSDGSAVIIWSSHADRDRLPASLRRSGLKVTVAHEERVIGERMTIFEARHSSFGGAVR